jgi:multidrug efflux pump subunit AcrA (membrane-fusion protein)
MATELVAPNNPWPVGWSAWHDFNKQYAADQAKAALLLEQQKAAADSAKAKAEKAAAENALIEAELKAKQLAAQQAQVKAAEEQAKVEQIVKDGIAKGLIEPLDESGKLLGTKEGFFTKNKKTLIIAGVILVVLIIIIAIARKK